MLERSHQTKLQRPVVFPYRSQEWVNELIAKVQAKKNAPEQKKKTKQLSYINGELTSNDKYPSSKWQTENSVRYKVIDFSRIQKESPPFILTSLDERYHNPHSKQIFHIRRINNKPVCSVHTWKNYPGQADMKTLNKSIYSSSFEPPLSPEPRTIIRGQEKLVQADGIVPFNQPVDKCNVKEEMFLPVCDTIRIPSAPNPHRYLLRKRKVPAPHQPMGIFYPESPVPDLPPDRTPTRISVSSLCGQEFTRRRYIPQPRGNFEPGTFDGGAPMLETNRMDEKYLPFVRVPPII